VDGTVGSYGGRYGVTCGRPCYPRRRELVLAARQRDGDRWVRAGERVAA